MQQDRAMQELFVRKSRQRMPGLSPYSLGSVHECKNPTSSGPGPSPCTTTLPVPPGNPGTPTTTRASQPTVLSGLEPSSASSQTADITGELDTPSPIPTLPNFMPMADPSFVWAVYDSATIISTISTAYDEVVCWRRNNFPVPTSKAGTAFVSELSWLFRAYAEGTALECVILKAITVVSILLLQKPHRKSKPREHTSCLEHRLQLWSEGGFDDLLNEGKALQGRLPKNHNSKNTEDHLAPDA